MEGGVVIVARSVEAEVSTAVVVDVAEVAVLVEGEGVAVITIDREIQDGRGVDGVGVDRMRRVQ